MTVQKISTNQRPSILDKRVFFCSDFPGCNSIHQHNLLYLHLRRRNSSAKYKWEFQFDILESGKHSNAVYFTEEEYRTIIQLFESKPFDWKHRVLDNFPSLLWYHYLTLDDAIFVANEVTEFAYRLHNDPLHSVSAQEMYRLKDDSQSNFSIHIYDEKNGQYQLSTSSEFRVEILLFNNKKIITKLGTKSMGLLNGYPRDQAIATFNPKREDGILLINHNARNAEFYRTDWNKFCLQVDRQVFPKK